VRGPARGLLASVSELRQSRRVSASVSQEPTRAGRRAGILLHPTSLPGPCGVGDLGLEAERFLDWAAAAGQTLWQVLPLGPTGGGASPYTSSSAFAGNPFLLSPERLVEEGLLPEAALAERPTFRDDRVDFGAVRPWKERLLRASFEHFRHHGDAALRRELGKFETAPEQKGWLADWSFFAALKERRGGRSWLDWEARLVLRDPEALEAARAELVEECAYQTYLQFLFFRQWGRIRSEARARGISVVGDVPIYVALDSADVWTHQDLFVLDGAGRPTAVSGVPPDYFSENGQLWGNPLYRWDRMEEDGFAWWIARLKANLRTCDLLRLDHFRAFAAYWAVPAYERTARNGRWVPGPGRRLFEAARRELGDLPILAEDLGMITEDVRQLLAGLGIPGMKVLQFAFYEEDGEYLPHRYPHDCVVYTGTHDNATARGWYEGLKPEERRRVADYLGCEGPGIEWAMIRAAYTSVADRAIVPMQDVLGLGDEARMNDPAGPGDHWSWRAPVRGFSGETAARLRRLAELTGRWKPPAAADPEAASDT
jgi:4-alpha-glucanotransferase